MRLKVGHYSFRVPLGTTRQESLARHLKDFNSKGEIFLEKLRSLRTEALEDGLEMSSLGAGEDS